MKQSKKLDFGFEHDDFASFMPDDGHDGTLYHNAGGDAVKNLTPEQKEKLAQFGAKALEKVSGLMKRESHPSCGKKPRKFSITPRQARKNKEKRDKWEKCVAQYELARMGTPDSGGSGGGEKRSGGSGAGQEGEVGFFNRYKVPIIVGGVAIVGLTAFLIIRK